MFLTRWDSQLFCVPSSYVAMAAVCRPDPDLDTLPGQVSKGTDTASPDLATGQCNAGMQGALYTPRLRSVL